MCVLFLLFFMWGLSFLNFLFFVILFEYGLFKPLGYRCNLFPRSWA
jgi:hypothetical protein